LEDEKNQERLVSKCWLEKKPLDIFAISKLLKKLLVSLEDRGIEASADIYKTFNRSRLPPDSQYGWRYYTLHQGSKSAEFFSERFLKVSVEQNFSIILIFLIF